MFSICVAYFSFLDCTQHPHTKTITTRQRQITQASQQQSIKCCFSPCYCIFMSKEYLCLPLNEYLWFPGVSKVTCGLLGFVSMSFCSTETLWNGRLNSAQSFTLLSCDINNKITWQNTLFAPALPLLQHWIYKIGYFPLLIKVCSVGTVPRVQLVMIWSIRSHKHY